MKLFYLRDHHEIFKTYYSFMNHIIYYIQILICYRCYNVTLLWINVIPKSGLHCSFAFIFSIHISLSFLAEFTPLLHLVLLLFFIYLFKEVSNRKHHVRVQNISFWSSFLACFDQYKTQSFRSCKQYKI